jgi:DNA helicase HerA-like ATPase
MSLQVGEVIAVHGIKITLKIFEESSKETIFFAGTKFKGVSIREYLLIQRGFREIVCIVEGEYLDETRIEKDRESSYRGNSRVTYIRKVEVKPIGYFQDGVFREGIKFLPMIKDEVFLASEDQITRIFGQNEQDENFSIGAMLKENIRVSLPWKRLFNTHIGIFGNTGSGKSNTLAKLYTTLFTNKKHLISGKSQFIVLDFNGEYTKNQLIDSAYKKVYDLSTRLDGKVKFPLAEKEFWNAETLGLLFKATQNTQVPFIKRVVSGREKYGNSKDSLTNYVKSSFRKVFESLAQKRESIDLLLKIMDVIKNENLKKILQKISWHGKLEKLYIPSDGTYFNGAQEFNAVFSNEIVNINANEVGLFEELVIRINLQLINDLISGYAQAEHIQPLLNRIAADASGLKHVIEISSGTETAKLLTVISLRKCNQEIKKVLPLLLAKHYYEQHKLNVENPPNKTIHIIIDEAHNVLSQQSMREQESWKDYRLELFEEIIKEGRKFGVFLTLSSQRPADISPTIMSQIHNFFIHRLVNDKDLFLLDNSISTLDSMSKSMIPNLAKGSCIVTGTSFDIPLLLQIDQLEKKFQPDSEDVDLEKLWIASMSETI